ncbi:MAG: hypothetical protein PHO79_06710 [Desulfoplanes sp.]|nr:hypothetical protein [Desulfoplanes sp.]MDD4649688.1 hypothetical protein [Desulfoplanes sp.]
MLFILMLPITMAMVTAPSEQSLVQASCQSCHSLKKVYKKMGQNETVWENTLNRMQSKGSGLNTKQNTLLATYLATTDAKTFGLCN